MAIYVFVFFAISLLVATSSAVPKGTKVSVKIPEECKGKQFCSIRPEGYDEIEEKINRLLPPFIFDLANRNGLPSQSFVSERNEDNCPSKLKSDVVYTALDGTHPNEVNIIVQTPAFVQKVEEVKCAYDDMSIARLKEDERQCFSTLKLAEDNLRFRCQEVQANRTLLMYDPDRHELKMKPYQISICCSCQITS